MPYLAFLIVCALVVLVVLRPVVRWLTQPPGEQEMLRAIPPGRTLAELKAEMPSRALGEGSTGRDQVARIASADSKQFADLLRGWISEE